jgi:hypothetical protein
VDETSFWELVRACRADVGSDSERVAQATLRRLKAMSAEEIVDVQLRWDEASDLLLSWRVHDAATLLFRQDEFDSPTVQDWVVSHGREFVRRVIEDPDRLIEVADDRRNATMEWFRELAQEAHIAVVGSGFDPISTDHDLPTRAEQPDAAALAAMYPRLIEFRQANSWTDDGPANTEPTESTGPLPESRPPPRRHRDPDRVACRARLRRCPGHRQLRHNEFRVGRTLRARSTGGRTR